LKTWSFGLLLLVQLGGLGVWGYKKWLSSKKAVSHLEKSLDAVEEAADKAEEVKEQVEEAH
jgi:hypothetical protein